MALSHPFYASTIKPTLSPYKISYIHSSNQELKPGFRTAHENKTRFNVVMKQSINLVESRKFKVIKVYPLLRIYFLS